MTDPKIEAIQSYLEAAGRQDTPAMLAIFADDLVYRTPGRGPISGETKGKAAALEYFMAISQLTGGTYAITGIVDWLSSQDRVILIANETATRKGKKVDWTRLVVFRFHKGLVSEVSLFDDRLYELDAVLGA